MTIDDLIYEIDGIIDEGLYDIFYDLYPSNLYSDTKPIVDKYRTMLRDSIIYGINERLELVTDEFDELKEENERLEDKVDDLRREVISLKEEIEELQDEVESLETKLKTKDEIS